MNLDGKITNKRKTKKIKRKETKKNGRTLNALIESPKEELNKYHENS